MIIGRSLIVTALFTVVGVGVLARPTAKPYKVDEGWLERQYPTSLGKFTMQPASDGSTGHSYRMDDTTYKTLKPYGIVGRILSNGSQTIDVVQIAGDSIESFHNPLLCFQAQEWRVTWSKEITIPTRLRGDVHATLAQATKGIDGPPQYALYTYEGVSGTFTTPSGIYSDMFKAEIKTGRIQFGTFFRFLTLSQNVSEQEIVDFAGKYLDECPVRPIEKLKA